MSVPVVIVKNYVDRPLKYITRTRLYGKYEAGPLR